MILGPLPSLSCAALLALPAVAAAGGAPVNGQQQKLTGFGSWQGATKLREEHRDQRLREPHAAARLHGGGGVSVWTSGRAPTVLVRARGDAYDVEFHGAAGGRWALALRLPNGERIERHLGSESLDQIGDELARAIQQLGFPCRVRRVRDTLFVRIAPAAPSISSARVG